MAKGVYEHKKRIPTCHPDRPHCAKGLCERCYRNSGQQAKSALRSYDPSLTSEEQEQWLEKRKTGSCEICGSKDRLTFDHDHESHKIRGILCGACNSLLGHSDDLPERLVAAKSYLHRKLPTPSLMMVYWDDAQDHLDPWVGEDDTKEFGEVSCPIVSMGYLVRKTKHYVVLAADWNSTNKDYGRVTKIPTRMITSMKELCETPNPLPPPLPNPPLP